MHRASTRVTRACPVGVSTSPRPRAREGVGADGCRLVPASGLTSAAVHALGHQRQPAFASLRTLSIRAASSPRDPPPEKTRSRTRPTRPPISGLERGQVSPSRSSAAAQAASRPIVVVRTGEARGLTESAERVFPHAADVDGVPRARCRGRWRRAAPRTVWARWPEVGSADEDVTDPRGAPHDRRDPSKCVDLQLARHWWVAIAQAHAPPHAADRSATRLIVTLPPLLLYPTSSAPSMHSGSRDELIFQPCIVVVFATAFRRRSATGSMPMRGRRVSFDDLLDSRTGSALPSPACKSSDRNWYKTIVRFPPGRRSRTGSPPVPVWPARSATRTSARPPSPPRLSYGATKVAVVTDADAMVEE